MKLAQQTQAQIAVCIVAIFFFVFGASNSMAGLFEKSSLSSPWKELFADVAQLNEYQKQGHTVELQNMRVENYNLAGARFDKAKFADTDWKNIIAKGAAFSNTTFRNCKLDQVRFEEATLKDVTFDHCEFTKVSFFRAQLLGVLFINCTLKDKTTFQASTNGTITFENATMNDVKFYKAQAAIAVKDSKINDGDFTSMQAPSSLTFEKSELKEVNFDRSILKQLTFIDSKIVESGGSGAVIDRFTVTRTSLDFGLAESRFKSIVISGSTLKALGLGNNQIQELEISDCTQFDDLGLYETKLGSLKINRCTVKGLRPRSATIDLWSVKDSQIANSKFEGMKVKTATLENVTLDKELNFTSARIDQLVTKNITKLPGLNLITTGSNVKFSD